MVVIANNWVQFLTTWVVSKFVSPNVIGLKLTHKNKIHASKMRINWMNADPCKCCRSAQDTSRKVFLLECKSPFRTQLRDQKHLHFPKGRPVQHTGTTKIACDTRSWLPFSLKTRNMLASYWYSWHNYVVKYPCHFKRCKIGTWRIAFDFDWSTFSLTCVFQDHLTA